MALNFNQYAKEANTFMKHYAKTLNLSDDKEKAGRILSSVLHALRELISTGESLQFISQLPMFLKAVYVNGWNIHKTKKAKNMEGFIDLVRQFNGVTASHDLPNDEVAENYIHSTFIALRQYVSLGELEDIRTELPKDLKHMVYKSVMF